MPAKNRVVLSTAELSTMDMPGPPRCAVGLKVAVTLPAAQTIVPPVITPPVITGDVRPIVAVQVPAAWASGSATPTDDGAQEIQCAPAASRATTCHGPPIVGVCRFTASRNRMETCSRESVQVAMSYMNPPAIFANRGAGVPDIHATFRT